MPRNTSVVLGEHFSQFLNHKIKQGRFESTSEAIRAGLRLLEADEAKLELLKTTLATGAAQLERGESVDGPEFMRSLIKRRA